MARRTIIILLYIISIINTSTSSFVFHENTNVMFTTSERRRDYFGYSTLLSDDGLLVGAPKGETEQRWKRRRWMSTTGSVFQCSLLNLDVRQVICDPLSSSSKSKKSWYLSGTLTKDSWFGASMASLTNHRLLIAAPRDNSSKISTKDGSLNGACYLLTPKRNSIWKPFESKKVRPTFTVDGARPEYGLPNSSIYYHPFGQLGFSIAVTKMNTVVLGVPGLLQFAGGIVSYSFDPTDSSTRTDLQPIANPYYTEDLGADDYFGYSVESGIFERNGSVLYIGGAPRSELARGKVLIFEPPTTEQSPLNVRAKLIGPQVGAYFGASLCSTDINDDGLNDLLVGAPTHVKHDGALPYDQGAVFVYITKESASGFILEESGYVSGSEVDGARFGTAIADLGDINGDGFRDIAIGAPWENNGGGAVYIYMGYAKGLRDQNVQRIQPASAQGFGWSISKGLDVDKNNCHDLAVGAYSSGAVYLYRCVPTISVRASIRVPNLISLPPNATTFTTMFCVSAPPMKFWPNVKLELTGRIEIDPRDERASLVGDSQYDIAVTPANEVCHEKTILVNVTADLLKPIPLSFELEAHELMTDDSITFSKDATRLSDDSDTKVSQLVQVLIDCGDDLICSPWLNVTLEALDNPYIPGTNNKFGVRLIVANEAEPAYGVKINIPLPTNPKRIPSECKLKDMVMTCDLPQPFLRYDSIVWEVEMEYDFNIEENLDVLVTAELTDMFYTNNITQEYMKYVTINVVPESNFIISGHSIPNTSIIVFRDNFKAGVNVSFKHFFKITNLGPSDRISLPVDILIPYKTKLAEPVEGCEERDSIYACEWTVAANHSIPVSLSLIMDLSEEGNFLLGKTEYIALSSIYIMANHSKSGLNYTRYEVNTTIILEPASIAIWCIIAPCIVIGLLLLLLITWILYKKNFFSRKKYDQLKYENNNKEMQDLSKFSNLSLTDDECENSNSTEPKKPFEMNI